MIVFIVNFIMFITLIEDKDGSYHPESFDNDVCIL